LLVFNGKIKLIKNGTLFVDKLRSPTKPGESPWMHVKLWGLSAIGEYKYVLDLWWCTNERYYHITGMHFKKGAYFKAWFWTMLRCQFLTNYRDGLNNFSNLATRNYIVINDKYYLPLQATLNELFADGSPYERISARNISYGKLYINASQWSSSDIPQPKKSQIVFSRTHETDFFRLKKTKNL
jgi:hypothetical protein